MPSSGLVISQIHGVTVATFREQALLDGPVLDAAASELYALVDDQARRRVVVDFTLVRFLSSQAVGVMIQLRQKARAIDGRVVLCGLQPNLSRIFEIMNLQKVLEFAPDEEHALNLMGVYTRP